MNSYMKEYFTVNKIEIDSTEYQWKKTNTLIS